MVEESADDLITSGDSFRGYRDGNGQVVRRGKNKANYPRPLKRDFVRVWPGFVGATPERQALTLMHEYVGHILGGVEDNDTVWNDKKIKGIKYLKYELDPTDEEIEAFFNQKGRLKRHYIGDTWAIAANEALKASEHANQDKRPSISAAGLRVPGKASEELPDWTLAFRKKGASGGQFSLRVVSRFAGPEDIIIMSGWQLQADMPDNCALIARTGTVKYAPDLERTQKEGDLCYNLLISAMLPKEFLEQLLAFPDDPVGFARYWEERSTATPERPYGSDVMAILALPVGVGHYDLFDREKPLKLKVVGEIFFANGPSKNWNVEFVPLDRSR